MSRADSIFLAFGFCGVSHDVYNAYIQLNCYLIKDNLLAITKLIAKYDACNRDRRLPLKYHIVDVFAERKYTGNPLAVVILEQDISDAEMQSIAFEFHFSETTFVSMHKDVSNGYPIRIFTPYNELPFAGHPVLGTAWVIREEFIGETIEEIQLKCVVGSIPIRPQGDQLWMKQIPPTFGQIFDAAEVAAILGLSANDLDSTFPVQEVSTGIPCMIIPVKDLNTIKRARSIVEKYESFFAYEKPLPLYLFTKETYEDTHHANCRMFADIFGIPEDPATGSAAGCLAAYNAKYDCLGSANPDIRLEQGYEINRPSIIHVNTQGKPDSIEVYVGGKVVGFAKGVLTS